jgi:hypothetical protein
LYHCNNFDIIKYIDSIDIICYSIAIARKEVR